MNPAIINTIFILILAILFLYIFVDPNAKLFGRKVWYDPQRLLSCERDGEQTSQQIFDIYSFSHVTHGILLYFILNYFNFSAAQIVYIATSLEILWEFLENTPYIIKKYRKNEAYKNYQGDTIVNILGDTICAVIGVYMAMERPKIAIAYAVGSELLLYPYAANFLYLSIGSLLGRPLS
ncbi:hypothetical protein LCGC14_2380180 [marine sediment metagenome]|uniref:Uncharacterized protein n=2 Tax=root TaxID=1 RepID=A0A0F9CNB7_9ZZZZ|nr:MAG: protein of unknown function DUF2585 [Marseillevirus LCMAC202]